MTVKNIIEKGTNISSFSPFVTSRIKDILKKESKEDTIDIFSKENVKIFDILVSAKKEICIACVTLDQIFSFNYIEVFKNILKNNIKIKILICDPKSDLLDHIKYLTVYPKIEENLTSCLSRLCNMKIISLSTNELANFEIRCYKTILTHNTITIDQDIESNGTILVEHFLFGIKSQNRKIIQLLKRKNHEIFDIYYKSFLKLWEISPEYSCEWEEL
ncbi:MAG TPA: hypothetical protein VJ767_00420 [Nitrososphaeraceae archaeon]|nr:hypothetical protein [Nitrososphaeraceae archaeon]